MKITTILLAILLLLANLASAEKKKFANNAAAVAYIQQMMDERGQRLVVKDMTGSTTKVSQKGCVLVFEDKAQFTHPTGYNDSAKGYSEQRTVVTQLNIEYADLAGTASNISFLGDNNSIKISTLWSSGKDGHEEFPKVYTLPLDYNGVWINDDIVNLKAAFHYLIKPCNKTPKAKIHNNILTRRS